MQAIILAAGKGSRISNETGQIPKSMLRLNENHTLLSFNFMQLSKCGINSIVLVTGFNSKMMEEYATDLAYKYRISLELVFNPFWDYCNVLGSLYMCLDKIEDDFIFLHADTISEITVLEEIIASKNDICLAVDFKVCGEEEMKFWIHNKKISRITKDDIGIESQGEFVGIAKFNQNMVKYIFEKSKEIFQSGTLNCYMEEVLDQGLIAESIIVDYFDATLFKTIEIDFMKDLELARVMFKQS
jgi:choline kinase